MYLKCFILLQVNQAAALELFQIRTHTWFSFSYCSFSTRIYMRETFWHKIPFIEYVNWFWKSVRNNFVFFIRNFVNMQFNWMMGRFGNKTFSSNYFANNLKLNRFSEKSTQCKSFKTKQNITFILLKVHSQRRVCIFKPIFNHVEVIHDNLFAPEFLNFGTFCICPRRLSVKMFVHRWRVEEIKQLV